MLKVQLMVVLLYLTPLKMMMLLLFERMSPRQLLPLLPLLLYFCVVDSVFMMQILLILL
jgi:hypothetical protein